MPDAINFNVYQPFERSGVLVRLFCPLPDVTLNEVQ